MMKGIVVWHSISGNTKKIALAIQKGIIQAGAQCDSARIREVNADDLLGYDLIGVGAPVYHLQEMGSVTEFIEYTMEAVDGKHGFAFCTHATMPAYFMYRVVPAMRQRGLIVIGWNDWFGAASHPCIVKPSFTEGHPDEIDLKEAEDFGRQLVERSHRISKGEAHLIPTFPRGRAYDKIYCPAGLGSEGRRGQLLRFANGQSLIKFEVDLKKCRYPKCTICIDNCHVGNIEFSESPPTRNFYCDRYLDRCWNCEMTCPEGAIEVDYSPFMAVHWQKRGSLPRRPSPLEIFEARGRFRRLISVNDVGWNIPFWTFKKPRLKVQ